ncbi:MAG: ATP-grasp domain-containing protein [Desulfobulbaceae bacterium]|nr:ATP-grasp domain-containing protein [Desulfobulbaceae bacterium]
MAKTDKWILIMGGGILASAMFERCRALGLKILAFEWNLSAPALKLADEVMQVNLKDMADVRDNAKKAGIKFAPSGVVTCGSDIEIAVAVAAEALALPGIPVQVAIECNDKVAMRRKLDAAGVGDTLWAEVENIEEAIIAADNIGYPCFFKPVDNCGSRGCKTITSAQDIKDWWDEAIAFSVNAGQRALIEEYQDGPRQTVEMIVEKGTPYLVSIIDTHYVYEEPAKYPFGNWPVETGLNTTELSLDMQEALFAHSVRVVKAMGVDFGPVKVDTTITSHGIKTVELTARLSGGFHCQSATPLAYGTDEISAVAKMALGEKLDKELIRHKFERAAVVQAKFPTPGTILDITGVDEAKAIPGVKEIFLLCDVGGQVGPYRNSTDRCAFVVADGDTLDEARGSAQRAIETLRIETK